MKIDSGAASVGGYINIQEPIDVLVCSIAEYFCELCRIRREKRAVKQVFLQYKITNRTI